MEKIGFFGGCFNPPTIAHLNLAKIAIKQAKLDKVIFVPMSNLYKKEGLISEEHRYNMLKILIKNEPNLEVSDMEFGLNKRLYAIDAFKMIEEKYNCEKFFIMGSDNFSKMSEWKSEEELKNFNYIVLDRLHKININKNVQVINGKKYSNISSTEVREKILKNENVEDYITKDVYQYIKLNNLYLKNED